MAEGEEVRDSVMGLERVMEGVEVVVAKYA